MTSELVSPARSILRTVDLYGIDGFRRAKSEHRSALGQFATAPSLARYMAGLFSDPPPESVRLLDAGAGVGALSAAYVEEFCRRERRPRRIQITAYEVDARISEYLAQTMELCAAIAGAAGIEFEAIIRTEDFIGAAVADIDSAMFEAVPRYNAAIMNPPYRKINTDSDHRRLLSNIGVETSNLYTAFLALATLVLEPSGELVAITPRSFCNGPYFKPFRQLFLGEMSLRRIHVFDSRNQAFSHDDVLQENLIFRAVKACAVAEPVEVSISHGPDDESAVREVAPDEIVRPDDPERFIHIMPDGFSNQIADLMKCLSATLDDLGVNISTGRVVDFRSKEWLRQEADEYTVPLVYPMHFQDGWIAWPKSGRKKHNSFARTPESDRWLVPSGVYVLTKRFSAKEEPRRVVAAIFDPERVRCKRVAFENHVNYYHCNGAGLAMSLAKGLSAYLNSTLVDAYFRNFNGHTQVNATDLRNLKYPTRDQLERLGSAIHEALPPQAHLDEIITQELLAMAKGRAAGRVFKAKQKIEQAAEILKALGMPTAQQNERSALTLLALLDLKPGDQWQDAKAPLVGITPMMEFFAEHYGKKYEPNTRETVRRQTVHQLEDAGIIVANPDQPRPVNSPNFVYQIESSTLELLQTYGTEGWDRNVAAYLGSRETLQERYAAERAMTRVPVTLPDGGKIELTGGGQNVLIKEIIEKFCPHYTPGGEVIYIGDAGDKFVLFERERLAQFGVEVDVHGKMPDVVVYHKTKGWVVLIEAVTSHGPVNPKRHQELKELFAQSKTGLVFVTAFLDRKGLNKYLGDIAWETEVWVAESPTHLIHFNGERFLGPHGTEEFVPV